MSRLLGRGPRGSSSREARRRRVVISIYDDWDNPYYAGGGPAVVRRIAQSLAVDYDVLVVTAGKLPSRRTADGVQVVYLPLLAFGPKLSQAMWALLLPIVAMVTRYSLWVESFTPPFSSNFLPLATRRPILGVAQSLSARVMAIRYGVSFPLKLERWLLNRYSDIVALNRHDAALLREQCPSSRIHVIENSTQVPTQPPTDAADGRYLLYLGRIDMRMKGLDLLLEAYAKLPESDVLPLVIAGSGRRPDEANLRRALNRVGPRVRWLGPVDATAKAALFADAAAVVVPSRAESFSLTALEAMAHGRPVLTFDLPQLSWIPHECGRAIPSFDVEALGASLADYSREAELRSAQGKCAYAFAATYTSSSTLTYRQLVGDLLGDPVAQPTCASASDEPTLQP